MKIIINDLFNKPYIYLTLFVILILTCQSGCGRNKGKDNEPQQIIKEKADSCLASGNYAEALSLYVESVKEAEQRGDRSTLAAATCNIGIVYGIYQDAERARYYFEKAYKIANADNNSRVATICATNLLISSIGDSTAGNLDEYLSYKKAHPDNDGSYRYWDEYMEAMALIRNGDTKGGRAGLKKAGETARRLNLDPELQSMVHVDEATTWLLEGNTDSAAVHYVRALRLNDDYSTQKREIYSRLIRIYRKNNNSDSLAKYQGLLLQLTDSVFNTSQFNLVRNELTNYEEAVTEALIVSIRRKNIIASVIILVLIVLLSVIVSQHLKIKETAKVLKRNYDILATQNKESLDWKTKYYTLEAEFEKTTITPPPNEGEALAECTPLATHKKEEKLDPDTRQRIDMELLKIMNDGKTIYDPDMSLSTVAAVLKINPNYVSTAIKEIYGVNFKTFVNRYRIEEACRRFADKENYGKFTIAYIAAECGFKSVNNFIVTFKKEVGLSPKQYRVMAEQQKQPGE